MKVYTNTSFEGKWPVGTAAVVRADNPQHAANLLNLELRRRGYAANVQPEEMEEFTMDVEILCDGDY